MGGRRSANSGTALTNGEASRPRALAPAPPAGESGVNGRNGSVGDSRLRELELAVQRLEQANEALARENARLARNAFEATGTAAAVRLTRAERAWADRVEEADRLARLLDTPRHRAVERARERLMRWRLLYAVVRRPWAWIVRR